MGYVAFVQCNCFRDGKAKEPPHKEFLEVTWDDGRFFYGAKESLYQENKELFYLYDNEIDEWEETACEHPKMSCVHEWIANVWGMGEFRSALEELGGERRFPVLSRYLPKVNGGSLPAEFAEQALRELESFHVDPTQQNIVILRERTTREIVYESSLDNGYHWFSSYRGLTFALHHQLGFLILQKMIGPFAKAIAPSDVVHWKDEEHRCMFQSKSFIQRPLGGDRFLFIDQTNGTKYETEQSLHRDEDASYPISNTNDLEFEVVVVPERICERYHNIVEKLIRLAHASIETGNPICWT